MNNKTLSAGEPKPLVQNQLEPKKSGSESRDDISLINNSILFGTKFTPEVSHVNFRKSKKKVKKIYKTSSMSDKISSMSDKLVRKYHRGKTIEIRVRRRVVKAKKINGPINNVDSLEKAPDDTKLSKEVHTVIINKKTKGCHKGKKHGVNLKLKYLKSLREAITMKSSNRQIRVYQSFYPLDSSLLMTDPNNITETSILGNYSEFKRIKQIIFDKEEQEYKYLVEEKFPGMADEAYFERQREYYCSWLNSQNNQKAHYLAVGLMESYRKDLKVYMRLGSDKYKSNQSKIHISQFSKNTQKHIKSVPYIRRLVVYYNNKDFPEVTEMSINQKYIDTVNYKPTFSDGMQGFKWLQYFSSKYWLAFHILRIQVESNFNNGNTITEPDFSFGWSCLKNEQGIAVDKMCTHWQQCWIENNNFYFEYYVTFDIN